MFSAVGIGYLLTAASPVSAEGSAQMGLTQYMFDRAALFGEGYASGDSTSSLYVDILSAGEVINISLCGDDDADDLQIKIFNSANVLLQTESLTSGNVSCSSPMTAPLTDPVRYTTTSAGTYRVELQNLSKSSDQSSFFKRYDISVTANTSIDPDPTIAAGRLWAYVLGFNARSFDRSRSSDANFYTLVDGGRPDTDYVWMLDLNKFAGFKYQLLANSIGVDAPNSGYSVWAKDSGGAVINTVTAEYPLYVGVPAIARPRPVLPPQISNASFVDDAGVDFGISPSTTIGVQDNGQFSFQSDVSGTYSIIVDIDQNGVFGNAADVQLLGKTEIGENLADWDGRDANGDPLVSGEYEARVEVRMGEFHFVADDVESSGGSGDPGLTIYAANLDGTLEDTRVYWDDISALNSNTPGTSTMPDGALSSSSAGRHTWGTFTSGSYGDNKLIDTYVRGLASGTTIRVAITDNDTDPLADTGTIIITGSSAPGDSVSVTVTDGDLNTDNSATEQTLVTVVNDVNGESETIAAVETGANTGVFVAVLATREGTEAGPFDTGTIITQAGDTLTASYVDAFTASGSIATLTASGVVVAGGPAAPDTDADGIDDDNDRDDDGDGIPDTLEGTGDTDGDGVPNRLDIDSDNDGIPDNIEAQTSFIAPSGADANVDGIDASYGLDGITAPADIDGDGSADYLDTDADNDGIDDLIEGHDANADGIADTTPLRSDSDGDGLDDAFDNVVGPNAITNAVGSNAPLPDFDSDTIRDWRDSDDDDDGIATGVEQAGDPDGDGVPNYLDLDSDADGLTDSNEGNADGDGNGVPDFQQALPALPDTDGDGVRDDEDADDDGDGIPDAIEGDLDTDSDGIPDSRDIDSDNDGIVDNVEAQTSYIAPSGADGNGDGIDTSYGLTGLISPADTDGDGVPDYRDTDADGDSIDDLIEAHDLNGDGVADLIPLGTDADGDGLDDAFDNVNGTDAVGNAADSAASLPDHDGDAVSDWRDTDDDGDGIPSALEAGSDVDSDGVPDYLDLDSDADGIADSIEAGLSPGSPPDTDADGTPDFRDLDADGDGTPDNIEGITDVDRNGVPDYIEQPTLSDADGDGVPDGRDGDDDGDGILDILEGSADADGDGVPNSLDIDSDNDGIPDIVEAQPERGFRAPSGADADDNGVDDAFGLGLTPVNTEANGPADYLDTDSDNDGIDDNIEAYDADGNGLIAIEPSGSDSDGDGLDDAYDTVDGPNALANPGGSNAPLPDHDGDIDRDWRDLDDDGDGIPTPLESAIDTDADGLPDYLDTDADGDGIGDTVEAGANPAAPLDTDGDGGMDYVDVDADNDGIEDSLEAGVNPDVPHDTDRDGTPDFRDPDADGDGVNDALESGLGPLIERPVDSDADGAPDFLDIDSDGDGIRDSVEVGVDPVSPVDTDEDGVPDILDLDSDGDGIPDRLEAGASPTAPVDTDADGVFDFRDPDADGDGIPDTVEAGIDALHPLDTDADGVPDFRETDSDADGIGDALEAGTAPDEPRDTDADGMPDYRDGDSDDDGIADAREVGANPLIPRDTDADGVPDFRDTDADGDSVPDSIEGDTDADGSGLPDYIEVQQPDAGPGDGSDSDLDGIANASDLDSDNDGVLDIVEGIGDQDGDGIPNYLDLDSDNDGVPDLVEAGGVDADGNSRVDGFSDLNADGADDASVANPLFDPDTDADGLANRLDGDSDADGLSDTVEAGGVDRDGDALLDNHRDTDGDGMDDAVASLPLPDHDTDGNGAPDRIEVDADADGLPDRLEGSADTDADGLPNYRDTDSDGDSLPDAVEQNIDTDNDGALDFIDTDSDGDGLLDQAEAGTDPSAPVDTDGDGVADYRDLDSDADGIDDSEEGDRDSDADGVLDSVDRDADDDGITDTEEGQGDSDGDGVPDYRDTDSDNDSIPDEIEGAVDTDGDGVLDYLDLDADNDGLPDSLEGAEDQDNDLVANFLDLDSDNDGIHDVLEGQPDLDFALDIDRDRDGVVDSRRLYGANGLADVVETGPETGQINYAISNVDRDSVADFLDHDSDNDGLLDTIESTHVDHDLDGVVDERLELGLGLRTVLAAVVNENGLLEAAGRMPPNSDSDPLADFRDLDSDNDSMTDIVESGGSVVDFDGDGRIDNFIDNDRNGVDDAFAANPQRPVDTDFDGVADHRDRDSDQDGIPDLLELGGVDSDEDGQVDNFTDVDGDGHDDGVQLVPLPVLNTDGDAQPDHLDLDSDNNGFYDIAEAGKVDQNGDGIVDELTDVDGDGIPDDIDASITRLPDGDGDGIINIADVDVVGGSDYDGDGIVDAFDDDADGDGRVDPPGFTPARITTGLSGHAGSGGCVAVGRGAVPDPVLPGVLALALLFLLRRRCRQ